MSRSEHHEKDQVLGKEHVRVALSVSFVNDCLFLTSRGGGVCGFALCRHGGGWIHGDWRLGKDVTTQGKEETVFGRGACGELLAFVFTFICDKVYHRMTVLCQTLLTGGVAMFLPCLLKHF